MAYQIGVQAERREVVQLGRQGSMDEAKVEMKGAGGLCIDLKQIDTTLGGSK